MSQPINDSTPSSQSEELDQDISTHTDDHDEQIIKPKFTALLLGCIGVVYGDIGTSPLYAFRETMAVVHSRGGVINETLVFGILSLIIWTLALVVSLKYVVILLKADNNGEGGTLTLVALAQKAMGGRNIFVLIFGIFGAAFFFGDAIVTPAMSVLSAMEGVELVAPNLTNYIVPITLIILIGLFSIQRFGTEKVGSFFGPIMVCWFLVLGLLGIINIIKNPSVFLAINPYYAVQFLFTYSDISFVILGAVCLAVSGAEGLYSDLGHFGLKPIRFAWFGLIFPCLLLNYFGQGALVLFDPLTADKPFFRLAPEWALLPLILLATLATVIASQAVITGTFSLTQQAIQLGFLPRLETRFTSETHQGQIYIPRINTFLLISVCLLVILFQNSANLSHAYGISVFATMTMSSLLGIIVIWKSWKWSLPLTLSVMLPFLFIDLSFFSANLTKLKSGGYVPLGVAFIVAIIMWTWIRGTKLLFEKTRKSYVPLNELISLLKQNPPDQVKGTAIFLSSDPETAPPALLHNLKHNRVLHEKNVILTIKTMNVPRVPPTERLRLEEYADGFWRVKMFFGYMETPNITSGLAIIRKKGVKSDIMHTSFFLSRRSLKPSSKSMMPLWQDHLFIKLSRSAADATDFFNIPSDRVVEIGTQVLI